MKRLFFLVIFIGISILVFGQAEYISLNNYEKSKTKRPVLPKRIIKSEKSSGITVTYEFENARVSTKEINSENYQYVNIEGFTKFTKIGAPAVPVRNDLIAIPGKSQIEVIIVDAEYIEYDGYNIHPALEEPRDTEGAPESVFVKDDKIYSTNAFFPGKIVELDGVVKLRGTETGIFQTRPVQFNPVSKKLRVYSKITYKVEFKSGLKSINQLSKNSSRNYTNQLKKFVLNPEIVPDGIERNDGKSTDSKNYIILTHSAYKSAADSLAKWKSQLGYGVDIVSRDDWTSEMVKNEIRLRWDNWVPKPDYFVIIGDHSGDFAVPAGISYDNTSKYPFATDLYYSCFDGVDDFHSDIAHGRISVKDPEEALMVVQKIINYERNPVQEAGFYSNGLNCAQFQDEEYKRSDSKGDGIAARRFCHTSEDVRNYMVNEHSYDVQRVYYTDPANNPRFFNNNRFSNGEALPPELLKENGFDWNGDATDILDAINSGKFYVLHRDHGYAEGIGWAHPEFMSSQNGNAATSDVLKLTNGNQLPVVFSINCYTGEFRKDQCFAEEFLRQPNGGAVGVVGAANWSYSGYNDGFIVGMFDAIWSDPGLTVKFGSGGVSNPIESDANNTRTMGDAMNQGLLRMIETWGESKYTHELFHWFGDPAMRIWTTNPNNNKISADHSNVISCDATVFEVSNSNAENAVVTLVLNDKLLSKSIIINGSASLNYIIDEPGELILTISKEDHAPYIKKLNVTGDCNFTPFVETGNNSSVSDNSAVCKAYIVSDSGNGLIDYGIEYTSDLFLSADANWEKVSAGSNLIDESFLVLLENLQANTHYYYRAYASNQNGIAIGEVQEFNTLCNTINEFPYLQEFSTSAIPDCWDNIDYEINQEVWRFDNPGKRVFNSTSGSNGFAILDGNFYGSGGGQDAALISPAFDFSKMTSVNLSFEHAYRTAFDTEASITYSIDDQDWIEIDMWSNTNEGSITSPKVFNRDLTVKLAGHSNVKFKWNYKGSNGNYWAIDDIKIDANYDESLLALTYAVLDVSETSVTVPCQILNPHNDVVLESGILYSYDSNLNLENTDCIKLNSENIIITGDYIMQINDLIQGSQYYTCAFVRTESTTVYGAVKQFKTDCFLVNELAFFQGFDESQDFPLCFEEEILNGTAGWRIESGNGSEQPANAYSGSQNLLYKSSAFGQNNARIILPPFNLTEYSSVSLDFMLHMQNWGSDVDQLNIWYKPNIESRWKILTEIDTAYAEWNRVSLRLPEISKHYLVALEAVSHKGYGVCVDDIKVKEAYDLKFNLLHSSEAVSNAQITLNNGESVLSDVNGQAIIKNLEPSNYSYTISKENLNDHSGEVEIIDQNELVEVLMNTLNIEDNRISEIEVYPNPASDFFYFKNTGNSDGFKKLEIISQEGKIIKVYNNIKYNNKLNINEIKEGIYYIRLFSSDDIILKKLIVTRNK